MLHLYSIEICALYDESLLLGSNFPLHTMYTIYTVSGSAGSTGEAARAWYSSGEGEW